MMGKHNLFRGEVPLEVVESLLRCFGLKGIDDRRVFTWQDLRRLDTAKRVRDEVVASLREYYLPCKARRYIDRDLTERRCLVIVRQLLRERGMFVDYRERNERGSKRMFYRICKVGYVPKFAIVDTQVVMRFD
eukprot:jgi/Chrzof1/1459/Cz10g08210.t1